MNQETFSAVFQITHAGGSGSCFYLSDKKLFVTNYHVVAGFKRVAVRDQEQNAFLGRVIVVNPDLDLALVTVDQDFQGIPKLELAPDEGPGIGDRVHVAGFPFGMPFSVTEGTISAPKQLMEGRHYLQVDAAVNPGNSGGPMFNQDGQVVGVTVSKFQNADNTGFGIRIENLRELLNSIEELERDSFHLQCHGCDDLIEKQQDYCPNCGEKLDKTLFEDRELSPFTEFCEEAIKSLGIDPVIARIGFENWEFYCGSSRIRMFDYDDTYLFCTSQINLLPKKNLEPALSYILTEDLYPYKLGTDGREIYLMYRLHLADITADSAEEVQRNIAGLAQKADDLDNFMVEELGCEFTVHSKLENEQ
ncbi:MAG: protease [Bacteroidetes bacterium]|nr:MAG: protease [Bacteroidota bacterium]